MLKVISDINYLKQRNSRFGKDYPGGAGYTYVDWNDGFNGMCFQPEAGSSTITIYTLIADKNNDVRVQCDVTKTCPLLQNSAKEYYISRYNRTDNFIKGSLVPCPRSPSDIAATQQVAQAAARQQVAQIAATQQVAKKRKADSPPKGIEEGTRVSSKTDKYIGTVVSNSPKLNDDGENETTITVIWDPRKDTDYDEDNDESMIKCTDFNGNRDKCKANAETCIWSDKNSTCRKRPGQKGKNDFLQKEDYNLEQYNEKVSEISEDEYQKRKKEYLTTEKTNALEKSKKQIYIPPIIINLKEDIGNAAALLSKVDAEKDLCGARVIREDFVKNKEKQREIIYKNIKELLKSTTDVDLKRVMNGYLSKTKTSNLDQVYEQLEICLGITIQFPLEIFLKLFPGTEDKITKETEKIFAYTVCHLHDETLMEELINDSKKYNISPNPDNLIKYISDWWDKYNPKTAAWVEADSGAGRILHSIRWLNAKIKNLHSFYSPATYIDAAGKKNSITNLLEQNGKTIEDFSNLEIGQRQNITINSKFGEILLNFTIERLSDTTNSQRQLVRRHILHIHRFFNLDCKKFGGAVDIGPNIDVNIIWGRLMSRVYNPDSSIYEHLDDDLTSEFDLCLKANKTSMDWLKDIYAIEFSKQKEYENIWSFFNDENAARIKEAMSERGITIYAPKMGPFNKTSTPERIVMKIKNLKHLYEHLGGGITQSATITSPVSVEPTLPPAASYEKPGYFSRCKSFVAGKIGLLGRFNDCEPFTNLQTIPNRGGGHCQFDSLAQIWIGINKQTNPDMEQVSLNIQNSIRQYIISNQNDFNFQGIDDQAQKEIQQFLSLTPGQGGWGNAATLGAWANITGAIICVYTPGALPIRIGPKDGTTLSGQRYNLYYNGTNHYEALIKREGTSFGKRRWIQHATAKIKASGKAGSFRRWCKSQGLTTNGKVNQKCITAGKHSKNKSIRKKANFAKNIGGFKFKVKFKIDEDIFYLKKLK